MTVSKMLASATLALVPAMLAATPAGADPARSSAATFSGVWRNTNNTVHIKAAPCGGNMCATVVWADQQTKADVAQRGRDIIGMQLLRDFRAAGDGQWKGTVYVPDRDMTVSGTITLLDRNTMRTTGCFLGVICQTRHWSRIS